MSTATSAARSTREEAKEGEREGGRGGTIQRQTCTGEAVAAKHGESDKYGTFHFNHISSKCSSNLHLRKSNHTSQKVHPRELTGHKYNIT